MSLFSDRLRSLREQADLSQSQLAKSIGKSKSSVNMYERGDREPGFETLEAIADLFNVDMDYLLGKSDIPNKYQYDKKFSNINKPLYSSETMELAGLIEQLDGTDRAEVRGTVKQMLKAEKYSKNKESKRA